MLKMIEQIIKSTKEFAEINNIPFDKRHEDMIRNAILEYIHKQKTLK